jgi:hypothetical protein
MKHGLFVTHQMEEVMKIRRVFKTKIDLNGNIDLYILYGKSCSERKLTNIWSGL